MPAPDILGPGTRIQQGYLAAEGDVEVRIRLVAGAATLTVKAGAGLQRTEVDVPIHEAAAALWPHTEGRRIDKIRHRVIVDATVEPTVVADVDVYRGPLDGLCTVEVEFATVAAARAFVAPAWFGREVTAEPAWRNGSLARRGIPDG